MAAMQPVDMRLAEAQDAFSIISQIFALGVAGIREKGDQRSPPTPHLAKNQRDVGHPSFISPET
jgi:hypothetical protein